MEKQVGQWSLWEVLKFGVETGSITAYKPFDEEKYIISNGELIDGDHLKYPILPTSYAGSGDSLYQVAVKGILNDCKEVIVPPEVIGLTPEGRAIYAKEDVDINGHPIPDTIQDCHSIRSQDIVAYRLKEDWFFDKQRSTMEVRIVAIAPVRMTTDGPREQLWVYFPEARYTLQNHYVYNEHNMARKMSYDDLFWKRKFQSTVDKESNVYNRSINDYAVGKDALLQAESIESSIGEFEHDVWSF